MCSGVVIVLVVRPATVTVLLISLAKRASIVYRPLLWLRIPEANRSSMHNPSILQALQASKINSASVVCEHNKLEAQCKIAKPRC